MQRNKHNTNNKVVENKREQITESSDSDVSTQEVPRRKKTPFPRQLRKRESSLTIRKDSMQGFVHLACILLFTGALQFCIRSYLKNGIIMDLTFIACVWGDLGGALALSVLMFAYSFICYFIVKLFVYNKISLLLARGLYTIYQILLYVIPVGVVFERQMGPLMGAAVALLMVIYSLKLHAYFATNQILFIKKYKTKTLAEEEEERFPKNIRIFDFLYFLAAPTLVYETSFPRNDSIRYFWALKELLQCFLCFSVANIIFTQFVIPVLSNQSYYNSDRNQTEKTLFLIYEILKISIPSLIAFILGFYGLFHCYLNCIAELLGFADREFYRDWWNAPSLDTFWKKWNILVHEWLFRHVYLESKRAAKVPSLLASFNVFLFSAVYHELILFMAFRLLRPWFFLAMFLQFPLILISRWLYSHLDEHHRDRWGNVFVWLSFFLGQPLIELLYLKEWFSVNPSLICTPTENTLSFL